VNIEKGVIFLTSFSACLFFVYRKVIDLVELIVYPATSLKLFIRFRSFDVVLHEKEIDERKYKYWYKHS
jgi:hypothetical protein